VNRLSADWRAALQFGVGVALVHRLLLTVWTSLLWLVFGRLPPWNGNPTFQEAAILPPLHNMLEQLIFGLWRRWDGIHYLDLAWSGYRIENPGPSVFGMLPPFGMRGFGAVFNNLDLGAAVFETLCFSIALVFLYRFVQVYFPEQDRRSLPRWSVITVALVPGSFFFVAPLSEAPFLAATIGLFYFSAQKQWARAALCGFLATLARTQGVLLLGIAGLIFLEQVYAAQPKPINWIVFLRAAIRDFIRHAWPLLLIPLALVVFALYRNSRGLPPLDEVYYRYSFHYFVNPLEGLLITIRWGFDHINATLLNWDYWIYGAAVVLALLMLRVSRHRRIALLAYNFGYLAVFVSKINWRFGTNEPTTAQSLARYCVILFPLAIFLADYLRHSRGIGRFVMLLCLILLLGLYSGMFIFGMTNP
jgi:hypothetical protein